MGRRGRRPARIASVSTPTRSTVTLRFRASRFRFCRQRKSTDAISGNVIVSLEYSSLAICEPANYTARPSKLAAFGLDGRDAVSCRLPPRSHSERTRLFACEETRGLKDPLPVPHLPGTIARGFVAGSRPANALGRVGVLRLRGCFAARSSYCAEDDSPVAVAIPNCITIVSAAGPCRSGTPVHSQVGQHL